MDDLYLIREMLEAPGPTARATMRARNQLTAAMTASHSAPGRRRPTRLVKWSLSGAVLSAGIAAVALATTALSPPPRTSSDADRDSSSRAAQTILVDAAYRAGNEQSGKYWHVESVVAVGGPYRVGAAPNRYNVVGRSVTATWIARDPQDTSWMGSLDLGYRPGTEADRRAWRRAGSPQQWDIPSDTPSGSRRLTMAAGPAELRAANAPTTYLEDLGGFDFAQIQRLPTDPIKLRMLLLPRIAATGFAPNTWESNVLLFESLSQLLLDAPAPPAVRAAAFTALAEIPGVHSVGRVEDADGRSGLGIELAHTFSNGAAEYHQLILDGSTYLIMGRSDSAGARSHDTTVPIKDRSVVIRVAEWTDQAPQPPTDRDVPAAHGSAGRTA